MPILRHLLFSVKKSDFVFLMPFIYFSLNIYVYIYLTANSLQPTEFKSVEIFKISLTVPEIQIKHFFVFLTYLQLRNIFRKS